MRFWGWHTDLHRAKPTPANLGAVGIYPAGHADDVFVTFRSGPSKMCAALSLKEAEALVGKLRRAIYARARRDGGGTPEEVMP